MDVLEAIQGRRSVRAFLDKPVDSAIIQDVLDTARWAPSSTNTQPWRVAVLGADARAKLTHAYLKAIDADEPLRPDYAFYPDDWEDPYKSRRFACGMALYHARGIERDDLAARDKSWKENFYFFHAPVAMIVLVPKAMSHIGSWIDMGMFTQNMLLAARGHGLETCAQASWAKFPDLIRDALGLTDDWLVMCGVAMGYADPDDPVNQYRTAREAVDAFTTFYD